MRAAAAILALSGIAGAISCTRQASVVTGSPPATPVVRVLSINDVYVADTLRDGTGGLARVAALRDSLARTGPRCATSESRQRATMAAVPGAPGIPRPIATSSS